MLHVQDRGASGPRPRQQHRNPRAYALAVTRLHGAHDHAAPQIDDGQSRGHGGSPSFDSRAALGRQWNLCVDGANDKRHRSMQEGGGRIAMVPRRQAATAFATEMDSGSRTVTVVP